MRGFSMLIYLLLGAALAANSAVDEVLALQTQQTQQSGDRSADATSRHAPAASSRGPVGDPDDEAVTEADLEFQLVAARASAPPRIDGVVELEEWRGAVLLDTFVQSQPDEGAAPTEATEVRLLYDETSLYISAVMHDSNPSGIVASVLRRDETHNNNDVFAVTLDTYHDHRNGFFFETNPLGAKFDAQIIGEGGGQGRRGAQQTFNADWDAVWYAAGSRTPDGWAVEIEIPFWSLRFDREPGQLPAWGINFRRTIRRKTEQVYWAPVPRQYNATRMSLSGMLVGLQGVGEPRNLLVKPYALGDVGQFPSGPDETPFSDHSTDWSGDGGLDIKWTITPNLTLDGTVNTDFAQVEADDVQVNLTRFPLFFPEKREFFLENAGLFAFGLGGFEGPRVIGFHSRNIGISDGSEVSILGGARLTGKAGSWGIGLMSLQTDSSGDVSSANNSVVRLRRDLGNRSSVGVMFTNQQSDGDFNRSIGIDGRWALDDSTTADGFWMSTSESDLEGGDSWAGAVSLQRATQNWRITGSVMEIGENFNPGLGFVNRTGLRQLDTTVMWTPYHEANWVRNQTPHVSYRYLTDRDGRLLTRRWHFDWDLFLKRGDKLSVAHNRAFEQLDLPFEIVPGVIIPTGSFESNELNFEFVSDPSRVGHVNANYTTGTFFGGHRKQLRLTTGFRAGARLSTAVGWTRNDIDLPGGDFVTNLWSTRISYDINTRVFLAGLFQYDNLTDQFFSNVRLNFIHTPGADLFLVYNERRLTEDPTLIDRAIILKATHLLRF